MDILFEGFFEFINAFFGKKIDSFFELKNSKLSSRSRKVISVISGVLTSIMIGLIMLGVLFIVSEDLTDGIYKKLGIIFLIVGGSYVVLFGILKFALYLRSRKNKQ